MDIIHNNDTAVAKAKSFLEIVEREIARSHDKKDNDDISGRADEFGNNGINLFLLSLDTLYKSISILNFYINIKFIFIDIERNSEIGGEQSPLLKQLLELVAREKARINDKETNDEIGARAVEFDNEGMNNFDHFRTDFDA